MIYFTNVYDIRDNTIPSLRISGTTLTRIVLPSYIHFVSVCSAYKSWITGISVGKNLTNAERKESIVILAIFSVNDDSGGSAYFHY